MTRYLSKRDGYWHFVRRVPKMFEELDRRGIVKQSTNIAIADDPRGVRAGRIIPRMNGELEAYWRGLIDGRSAEAERRYDAARKRARLYGFDYALAQNLAEGAPILNILQRVERLVDKSVMEDNIAVAGVLGGEAPPAFMLSSLFDAFETAEKASLQDLSPDQMRKWRNPKIRALHNLLSVIGDKDLHSVSREDALDFREWWQERIITEDLDVDTANKDFGHINKMWRTINRLKRLGLQPVFSEMRFEGGKKRQRNPFDTTFIQNELLREGALADLNEEARRLFYLLIETGLRPSEAANLTEETIILNVKVPFVRVIPDGRRLKTPQSEREIPLVGVALEVMRLQPNGFPRYRDKASSFSALVNKYLRNNNLSPNGHTVYSLRHSFEDRLTEAKAPDKLFIGLMGHKGDRPKYGKGPSLELKQSWLQQIALTPPPLATL